MLQRYTHADGLEFRDVGDETLLYDHVNARVHVLTGTAGAVLQRCTGATVDELGTFLSEQYDVDDATARRDVAAIMDEFVRVGVARPDQP